MVTMQKEEEKLKEVIDKLIKQLENTRKELSSKKGELKYILSACNLYSSQLQNTQYDVSSEIFYRL